jgi:CheY-like chemotaxis protein
MSLTSTSPRVLLLENDPLIAMTLADQLDDLGYDVVGPAHSLVEAVSLATEGKLDAALLDWNTEGKGSGVVADILIRRDIPFAFVTGYAEIADGQYRDIPLLNKPFSMEMLARAVESILR